MFENLKVTKRNDAVNEHKFLSSFLALKKVEFELNMSRTQGAHQCRKMSKWWKAANSKAEW